mmetsp:Transcript_13659/g.20689  ORF Transcript_13659/g.20689 Transcript_13659/m.20689 type:complete len:349 (-) Transcript_13659:953-1999(-)
MSKENKKKTKVPEYPFEWLKFNFSFYSILRMIAHFVLGVTFTFIFVSTVVSAMTLAYPLNWIGYKFLYAKIASFFCALAFIFWCLLIEYNLDIEFSGDILPKHENALLISNHIADTDFILLMNIAARHGMLGNLKYFAKDSLKYFPIVGWGMYITNMIFLKRNWNRDKTSIENTFKYFIENNIPLWMVNFLEGTRMRKSKLEESIAYQQKNKLNVTSNVMCPRVKGFVAMVQGLRDHQVDYIYDITFCFADGRFSIMSVLLGMVNPNHRLLINLKRIPITDLPQDDEGIKKWCYHRFEEKDKLLASYDKKTKSFKGQKTYPLPLRFENWITKPFSEAEKRKKDHLKKD